MNVHAPIGLCAFNAGSLATFIELPQEIVSHRRVGPAHEHVFTGEVSLLTDCPFLDDNAVVQLLDGGFQDYIKDIRLYAERQEIRRPNVFLEQE